MTTERKAAHNSSYPKGGVWFFADTFLQAESSVLRMKFSGKNPALRVAANRCASFWRKAEKTENEENPNNHYYNFNFLNWVL